jgi:hypothetical protein
LQEETTGGGTGVGVVDLLVGMEGLVALHVGPMQTVLNDVGIERKVFLQVGPDESGEMQTHKVGAFFSGRSVTVVDTKKGVVGGDETTVTTVMTVGILVRFSQRIGISSFLGVTRISDRQVVQLQTDVLRVTKVRIAVVFLLRGVVVVFIDGERLGPLLGSPSLMFFVHVGTLAFGKPMNGRR